MIDSVITYIHIIKCNVRQISTFEHQLYNNIPTYILYVSLLSIIIEKDAKKYSTNICYVSVVFF